MFLNSWIISGVLILSTLDCHGMEVYLPEVEVKAKRQLKTYRSNSFDHTVRSEALNEYESIPEALSYETQMMQVNPPVGTDVTIDGLGQDRNLVLIDGIPQTGRVNGTLDYDFVPFFMLERVRVSRHPGNMFFGDQALGGSILMNTYHWDMPYEQSAKMGFRGTTRNFLRGDFTHSFPLWDGHGMVRYGMDYKRQVRHFLPGHDMSKTDLDDLSTGVGVIQYHHRLGARHKIMTSLLGGEKLQAGILDSKDKQIDRWKLQADAAWLSLWNETFESEQIFNVAKSDFRFQEDFSGGSFLTNELTQEVQFFGGSRWTALLNMNHKLLFGADIYSLKILGVRVLGGEAKTTKVGFYVGSDHKFLEHRWKVESSIRVDVDSVDLWTLAPRVQSTVSLTPDWDVFFGGGIGHKRPDLKQRFLAHRSLARGYQVFGDPTLSPEISYGLNGGMAYRYRHIVGKVGYDFKSVRNLILPRFIGADSAGFLNFLYMNVSRSIIHQAYVEFSVSPWSYLEWYFRYTFLWARDLDRNEPLPQSPEHSILTEVKFDIRSLRSDIRAQVHWLGRSGFFDENRSGFLEADEFMPSHAFLNLYYNYHLTEGLTFFARGKNIANVVSRKFGLAPGFELMLGVRYESSGGGS